MREKAIVSWSGGKDSALALYEVAAEYDIAGLLTTVTSEYERISMHGVRTRLLEQQAASLGYPLEQVRISPRCGNDEYERQMGAALTRYRIAGVTRVICGDIFLEDVRRYREERLLRDGLSGVFPLWQRDSRELAYHFIRLGFRAVLCCVDTHALDQRFVGRVYDETLLADLPATVDPCGENGEFHTFVFAGPNLAQSVPYSLGEYTLREGRFGYRDLLPA
ncbi:MAG TPA: ATP-binding protein [Gemmataceae bacterium]|nr:ATP-binding protein [Gemmataceae bacterium]